MNQEIELKLALPRRALAALRRHPLIAGAEKLGRAVTLDNTYYDTPALRLKARRIAVRTRRQGRAWLQTVKCAAVSNAGLSQRPEWEQTYTGAFDFSQVDLPEAARLLARRADDLVPVFTTRFRRETRRLCPREGVSILIMIDTGEVRVSAADGSERQAPICELELELEQGLPADLFALACQLAETLPLMPSDLSKAERGYRLFMGSPLRATRAETSALKRDQNGVDAFRSLAFSCVRQWQANAEAALSIKSMDVTPEDALQADLIHQLRVALRRLRALLKLFAPILPVDFAGDWNLRLRDNARRLGEARDLDVLNTELLGPVTAGALADAASMAELLRTASQAREDGHLALVQALEQAPQGRLLLEFGTALMQLPPSAPKQTGRDSLAAAVDLRKFARLRVARLRKRIRKQFDAASALEPARLHALRVGFKQLRYSLEFLAPLFPPKTLARYQRDLKKALRTLGFLQDVDIARERMLAWAADDATLTPAAAFVLGWHAPRYGRLRSRVLRECEPLLWGKTPWQG